MSAAANFSFVDETGWTPEQRLARAQAIVDAELAEQGIDPDEIDPGRLRKTYRLLDSARIAS